MLISLSLSFSFSCVCARARARMCKPRIKQKHPESLVATFSFPRGFLSLLLDGAHCEMLEMNGCGDISYKLELTRNKASLQIFILHLWNPSWGFLGTLENAQKSALDEGGEAAPRFPSEGLGEGVFLNRCSSFPHNVLSLSLSIGKARDHLVKACYSIAWGAHGKFGGAVSNWESKNHYQ